MISFIIVCLSDHRSIYTLKLFSSIDISKNYHPQDIDLQRISFEHYLQPSRTLQLYENSEIRKNLEKPFCPSPISRSHIENYVHEILSSSDALSELFLMSSFFLFLYHFSFESAIRGHFSMRILVGVSTSMRTYSMNCFSSDKNYQVLSLRRVKIQSVAGLHMFRRRHYQTCKPYLKHSC